MSDTNPWLDYLQQLKPSLQGTDQNGKRGSLRWFEAALAERGGKAGTVRNILYKNLGSPQEKLRFYELLLELFHQAGLATPPMPIELSLEAARRPLGHDKRRLFRRFLRGFEQGDTPQMVVVGGAATGKGVLLSAIQRTLPQALFVNLGGELAQCLFPLAERLGFQEGLEGVVAQLSPTQPYALNASLQEELQRLLAQAINQTQQPLLLRAEPDGQLGGLSLRNLQGERVKLAAWVEPLLQRLRVPYVAALSEAPPQLSYQSLQPPSREEARRFVRDRLPDLAPERLEELVNRAGRNFAELQRLVLLESAQADDLQNDHSLRPLLAALSVFSMDTDPAFPATLLEQALGKKLSQLSQAERALLVVEGDLVRPALRTVLLEPPLAESQALHRLALKHYGQQVLRSLYHAQGATDFETVLGLLAQDPSRLALRPGLWAHSVEWPTKAREGLAQAVVQYRAVLGQYTHPEALEALEVLGQAHDPELRNWAKVKLAEAHIDAGNHASAAQIAPSPHTLQGQAQVEGLLVWAALERWRGDYVQAALYVRQALQQPTPPFLSDRVRLWQGLVAKDAGRFAEALESLDQVHNDPLLVARAQYQMGDLLMRLGEGQEAVQRIRQSLQSLQTLGTPEETARVRARLGTALRRLGQYPQAAEVLYAAIQEAPDAFTQARAQSEASILESARQHPWEALSLAAQAELTLSQALSTRSAERSEEARYRHRRTLLRLAIAYWVQETGQPYRPPFLGGRPAPQARKILEWLMHTLKSERSAADRYASLSLDTAQMLALLDEPQPAQKRLRPFLKQSNPHLALQAGLSLAEAQARASLWGEVLAACLPMPNHPQNDPASLAWKLCLQTQALFHLGQPEAAWEQMQALRSVPTVFRQQASRVLAPLWPAEQIHQRLGRGFPLAPAEALALFLN